MQNSQIKASLQYFVFLHGLVMLSTCMPEGIDWPFAEKQNSLQAHSKEPHIDNHIYVVKDKVSARIYYAVHLQLCMD